MIVKHIQANYEAQESGHPPYSPALTSGDFLFPYVKTAIKGRLQGVKGIKHAVTVELNAIR
jgi:hypothetical protein